MNKKLLVMPALLALASAHAQTVNNSPEHVRPVVTLNAAKDKNILTPENTSITMVEENQDFGPEDQRPFIIRSKGKDSTSKKEWKDYSLSFTPEISGYVWLSLEGEYPPKETPNLVMKVDIDDVAVEGAKLENGDFAEKSADGNLKSWIHSAEAIVNESSQGEPESSFVTVSANNRLGQTIRVTAGQLVTITFKARAHTPPSQ
jgi:hypothetical protein